MTDPARGWSGARRVFQFPFARARIGRVVDEELRFHIEGRIEQFMERGMTREQAEAEARRRFGDYDEYRRQACDIDERTMRDRNRLELFDTLRRELGHAVRALVRTPAFTAIAFVTLALGLGATTAIYTILEAVVLRPLPYPDADRLVSVLHPATVPGTGESTWGLSSAGYFYFRRENHTLADLGAFTTGDLSVSGDGEAERARVGLVTHPVLSVLRAKPAVGRLLTAEDDRPKGPSVAMLGYDFWQRRYGGDPRVVGRVIQTSVGPYEVVGVTAKAFSLPKPGPFSEGGGLAGFRVDLWLPLQLDPNGRPVNSHQYFGVGRLRPGVTADAAERDLQTLTNRLPELFPTAYSTGFMEQYHFRMGVAPLRDQVIGEKVRRSLWVLFGAVGLVLAIACANVANLFLVRTEARRRESAIRTALGAGRAHMAAHYLAESLLLALVAGAAGVALAHVGTRVLLAIAPADIPRLSEVGLRWTAIAFAAGISLAAGVAFGLFPLLRTGRVDVDTLREGSRGLGHSPRQRAARNGLVVAQVSLALMLLAAAGLMIRSFSRLRSVRPGLDPRGVLVFEVGLTQTKYPSHEAAAAFHRELQSRIAALPGVRDVGAATGVPLQDFGTGCAVVFRQTPPYGPDEKAPCVATPLVTPGFFRALGIPVQGRAPDWSDVDANTGAVVVTKALADRLWPGEDPVGKGINSGGMGKTPGWYRVVGVVRELRAAGLDKPPTEVVFYPAARLPGTWLWEPLYGASYVVRTASDDPAALTPSVRRVLAALDPTVPLTNARTMGEVVGRSMARTSFIMVLLGVAAGMALLLSAVGIYGVISYVVAQRRPEIGIRMALGARISQVARLVVMQSVRLALVGVVLGLAGAVAGTRVMRSLLYDVSPTDPVVLAVVPLVLLAIAALASFAPARRAARVDPVEALRNQ